MHEGSHYLHCTAGDTAHRSGLPGAEVREQDVLEIAGFKVDLKLGARPQEVPRALQGEMVALDRELLPKLRKAGTFNSHLCHTYSLSPGRRPGLEASDFVAMASGRVSVCWSLPGGWTLAGWMLRCTCGGEGEVCVCVGGGGVRRFGGECGRWVSSSISL